MVLRLMKPDETMEFDVMNYRAEFLAEGKTVNEGATGLAETE